MIIDKRFIPAVNNGTFSANAVSVEWLFLVFHIEEDVCVDCDLHSFLNLRWNEMEDSGIGLPRERISESF